MHTNSLDIPALAAEFTAAHPDLDPVQQRVVVATFRLHGEGESISPERLAERVGLPVERVASSVDELPMVNRDEPERILAVGGLSLEPTSHLLEVDRRTLYAACALDTLFLPELLGRPAQVRSSCPETGESISLTVDSAGVHDVTPPGAVMSLHGVRGFSLEDAIGTFCHYVHFFASERAARAWTEGKEDAYIASIDQGFEYGRLFSHGELGAALDDGDR